MKIGKRRKPDMTGWEYGDELRGVMDEYLDKIAKVVAEVIFEEIGNDLRTIRMAFKSPHGPGPELHYCDQEANESFRLPLSEMEFDDWALEDMQEGEDPSEYLPAYGKAIDLFEGWLAKMRADKAAIEAYLAAHPAPE